MTRSIAGFLGVLLFSLGLACDDPAPDLAEWTTADHTHQTEKTDRKQRRAAPLTKPATYTQPSKHNMLVEVTWMKQCSTCHGKRGKGDGPQSPMVKAKDLTSQEWQSSVSDEQISRSIKGGKGKMPAFNFPESMLTDLVAHVRLLPQRAAKKGFPQSRADQAPAPAAAAPAPAPEAAPAAEEEEESSEGDEASAAHGQ